MKIELKQISIKEVIEGYKNDDEEGVVGYKGKLNIRPKYQREFVYKDKQRNAVIETIRKDFPLNVMYWVKNKDGTFEVMDGQYDSLVWLKFQPKEINLNSQNYDGLIEWLPLFQSVGSKNDLLTLSNKIFSDDKTLKKAQTDGSVGILGCILSKYILCVEPNKIDNLDFFNTYKGQNPTVPTVCEKKQSTATIKQEVQTAKTPKNKPTLSSKKSKSNKRVY